MLVGLLDLLRHLIVLAEVVVSGNRGGEAALGRGTQSERLKARSGGVFLHCGLTQSLNIVRLPN